MDTNIFVLIGFMVLAIIAAGVNIRFLVLAIREYRRLKQENAKPTTGCARGGSCKHSGVRNHHGGVKS